MLKDIMTIVISFIASAILICIFVLWTDYAYQKGVEQATYAECEANAGQIN